MRVGTFLRSWFSGGGVTRHTLELVERLDDIDWVCFGHEFDVDVPNPVQVSGAPGPRAVKDVANLARSSWLFDKLRDEHDLDLFHAQDANTLGHDLITVHGCFPAYAQAHLSRLYTLVHPMYYKNLVSQKIVLERTDGPIIAVSSALRSELLDFYDLDPDQVHVIHNGVDLDTFHPDLEGAKVRQRHDIDSDTPLLVFVGHEYERKGYGDLLPALAQTADAELLSVGGGDPTPWKERARDLGIEDRITWTGFVPDEELPEHYAAGDAFVFPTRYEAHSLVVLEALASGLPVVLGDIPATREVVTDGEEGRLVEPGAVDTLADAIEHVLGDEGPQMANRARERAEQFGWDAMAEKTEAMYERVLAEQV